MVSHIGADGAARYRQRDVALRIAELRRRIDLTQEEFADRCDVTPHWIRQVEGGRANLTIATLVGLAEQLDVDVAALFQRPKSRKAGPGRPKLKQGGKHRRS